MTVGLLVGILAAGETFDEILAAYPYLARQDIAAAFTYAAWRAEERELSVDS